MKLPRDCGTRERHQIVRRIRDEYRLSASGDASIYVLHFVDLAGASVRVGPGSHYLGFSTDLERRIGVHRIGEGARIIRAVLNAGHSFVLALAFRLPYGRVHSVERQLKRTVSGAGICPICLQGQGAAIAMKQPLDQALLHAIGMERRAATRVKRAATVLHKWQSKRRRIERRIGEAEVQRILNSQEAFAEITKKKNTVRRTVKRLIGAGVLPDQEKGKQGFLRRLMPQMARL